VTRSVARRISVKELAEREGVHTSTIRRRLARLHASTGGKAPVMRLNPGNPRSKIVLTTTSLAMADKRLVEEKRTDAEKVALLEETVRELRRTISSMKSTMRTMREAFSNLLDALEARATSRKSARKSG
jgi:DNA-binding Lrp family transcriptional regulator